VTLRRVIGGLDRPGPNGRERRATSRAPSADVPRRRRSDVDALVTDVQLRSAVAGVRGLGRAGLRVMGMAPTWAAAGRWSRYVSQRTLAPDPGENPDGFARAVVHAAVEHAPAVIFPGREAAIDPLLGARERLPAACVLPYPEGDVLALLRDKRRLRELGSEAGMPAPDVVAVGTAGEVSAASLGPGPFAVKPAVPGGMLETTAIVPDGEALRDMLRRLPGNEAIIVQEHLAGPLMALILVLARDGSVAARFQQTAGRTWPVEAGASASAVSMAPDERLVERAARMLTGAGYWGLAHLQFLDGGEHPALIDANLRFYGSLPLALMCGVNLPAAWHAVALDRAVPKPGPYRVGVQYRWLEGDLSAAFGGHRDRLLARTSGPKVGAMWAADDPLSGALLGVEAAWVRAARRARRLLG
jgi:predicted ATP-grasp superfamily ATP-dependent carboligase